MLSILCEQYTFRDRRFLLNFIAQRNLAREATDSGALALASRLPGKQLKQAKWWTSCFTCAVGPLVFSLLYMLEYVCVVLDAWSIAMLMDLLFFYCRLEYCSMLEYLREQ